MRDLGRHGAALVRGTDASSTDSMLVIARSIGRTELDIDAQLSGPLVMDLRHDPVKRVPGQRPAYFTADVFPLHTDVSYVETPPRYLLTQCVVPDAGGGGVSLVADCRRAWTLLSPNYRTTLSREIFTIAYPPNCALGEANTLSIYQPAPPMWRFRLDSMR
ncbi:MAG: hypothetical protein QOD83_4951 [Solirubrobacteraceae bacterium]|nr:hypothetical protein [Solirubrobacteraceae bacterium]